MRRFILTGAPGSGKTSILRELQANGYAVIEEAATDIIAAKQGRGIAEPWLDPSFIDKIIELQRARQQAHASDGEVQIYDRAPVCTLALARFLGHPATPALTAEIERIVRDRVYDGRVFLVRPLGFIEPTSARRISYQDSLEFERFHEAEYRRLGFQFIDIPPLSSQKRAAMVDACVRSLLRPR